MAFSSQSGSSSGYSSSSNVSTSAPVMNPGAQNYYQQLLDLNRQNYRSISDAYSGSLRNAHAQLPGIYSSYGQVQRGVMNTLGLGGGNGWGVATPAAQAIQRTYQQQLGANQQNLINAGLGQSSVLAQLNNATARQASESYGGLGAQLAQTAAGYQSQFGLAQAQARMQGLGLQTGLGSQLGNTLGGYHFANTFGNLYGQQSNSQGQSTSQNSSVNSGSSYSPSGGGGYGGGGGGYDQNAHNAYGNYGLNAGQMFPGEYLGGAPSGYYANPYQGPPLPPGNVFGGGSINPIDSNLFGAY